MSQQDDILYLLQRPNFMGHTKLKGARATYLSHSVENDFVAICDSHTGVDFLYFLAGPFRILEKLNIIQ